MSMEDDDIKKLVRILANKATYSGSEPKTFFGNLVRQANLPDEWLWDIIGKWTGHPRDDGRFLIQWATNSERRINTKDTRFTTLGSILNPLLPQLGLDEARSVIWLIIRYSLYENTGILIKELADNPSLQNVFDENSVQIINQYASHLLSFDSNPVSDELVEYLIKTLQQLNNFNLTLPAFLATFNIYERDIVRNAHLEEIAIIKDSKINIMFRIFTLFKLLLEEHPYQADRIRRLMDFCEYLQEESPEIRNKLKTWLHKLKSWLQAVSDDYEYQLSSPSQPETSGVLEPYLMIIIRPAKSRTRGKLQLDSFLIIGDSFSCRIEPDTESEKSSYDQNLYTLKEAENYVAELIDKSENIVHAEKTKLKCESSPITIEFFMPCIYLYEKVDQWGIELLDEKIPIGKDYRVAVRSYERIASVIGEKVKGSALLLRYLEQKWKTIQNFLSENSGKQDIKEQFECLCQSDTFQEIHLLETKLRRDKLGLKLACTPPEPEEKRERLFKTVLLTGIPIAIWLRQNKIPRIKNLEKETDKFLKREYLSNLSLLLDCIKKEREIAYDNRSGLGQHLAILCDDPNRLPPAPPPLMTSAPLSLT
ncbi:MAG: hypothetical protein AB4426_06065 [Xenococcaceae cyanobacterium]